MSDEINSENRRLIDRYTEIARLAGGLAHEIKNPLSTIRLNMELLGEDFQDPKNQRERRALRKIEVVERECQRLQDLLDDFLNFAKVRQLHREPTNFNDQVRRLLDFFRPKAEEAGIEIIAYLASDLPTVLIDREVLHGALLNLVLNAQQAIADGGQLVARTYPTADGVGLDLIDTGCGIDPDALRENLRRFLFHQKRRLGLGLAHHKKSHRSPRRKHFSTERTRPRYAIHDPPAGAAANLCRG